MGTEQRIPEFLQRVAVPRVRRIPLPDQQVERPAEEDGPGEQSAREHREAVLARPGRTESPELSTGSGGRSLRPG